MDGKPVLIELIDAKTKEPKDTLEVNVCTFSFFFITFASVTLSKCKKIWALHISG